MTYRQNVVLGSLPLCISWNLLHNFRYWVAFSGNCFLYCCLFLQVRNKSKPKPNPNHNPNPNPKPNGILSFVLRLGDNLPQHDLSCRVFKKQPPRQCCTQVSSIVAFLTNTIYILVKRKMLLIFLLWITGEKWFWVHYPSTFRRTYCITLGIGLLYREMFPCIVAFFLQVSNKSKPKTNHKSNPNNNPTTDLTITLTLYRLSAYLGVKHFLSMISPAGF